MAEAFILKAGAGRFSKVMSAAAVAAGQAAAAAVRHQMAAREGWLWLVRRQEKKGRVLSARCSQRNTEPSKTATYICMHWHTWEEYTTCVLMCPSQTNQPCLP